MLRQRTALYLLILLLLILMNGCGKDPRKELAKMNIPYSEACFFERIRNSDIAAVKLFLDAGMSPNAENEWGQKAMELAVEKGDEEIVKILLEKGANISAQEFVIAAQMGHAPIVKMFLEKGANVNAKDCFDDSTALIEAADGGYDAVVKTLLDKGVDVNAIDRDGYTALMKASSSGQIAVVQALIDKGADVNIKNSEKFSALILSAEKGHNSVVQALLAKGADVRSDGDKAATLAKNKGYSDISKMIWEAKERVDQVEREKIFNIVAQLPEYQGSTKDLYAEELKKGVYEVKHAVDLGSGLLTTVNAYLVVDGKIVDSLWRNGEFNESYKELIRVQRLASSQD